MSAFQGIALSSRHATFTLDVHLHGDGDSPGRVSALLLYELETI